jgi:hypothetical protein
MATGARPAAPGPAYSVTLARIDRFRLDPPLYQDLSPRDMTIEHRTQIWIINREDFKNTQCS